MVHSTLTNSLRKHGVTEYIPKNEKFDPNKHEAVFDFESDELPAGSIGQVLQSGFKIGERVLRPAKVGVIKKK
jgi:molecular chaperone GrpE